MIVSEDRLALFDPQDELDISPVVYKALQVDDIGIGKLLLLPPPAHTHLVAMRERGEGEVVWSGLALDTWKIFKESHAAREPMLFAMSYIEDTAC